MHTLHLHQHICTTVSVILACFHNVAADSHFLLQRRDKLRPFGAKELHVWSNGSLLALVFIM